MRSAQLLLLFDLVGIFVFSLSGALAGVAKRLDIFGVAVVASVSAIGGGLARDLLLGQQPPAALKDWRYLTVPIVGAMVVFFLHPQVRRAQPLLLVLDAAGLALFTVAGAQKALDFHLPRLAALGIGIITAIGGGMVRDVLLREIPVVLQREIYAVAALSGAVLVVAGDAVDAPRTPVAVTAVALIFVVRLIAVSREWSAPRAVDQ